MKALQAILNFLAKILKPILGAATGELIDYVREWAVEFRAKAEATDNPWDDILAEAICIVLGVK